MTCSISCSKIKTHGDAFSFTLRVVGKNLETHSSKLVPGIIRVLCYHNIMWPHMIPGFPCEPLSRCSESQSTTYYNTTLPPLCRIPSTSKMCIYINRKKKSRAPLKKNIYLQCDCKSSFTNHFLPTRSSPLGVIHCI